ncbi:MAG: nickel-dependent lactate racemase [Planctomycetaceae bacterium]|nr:nickel-dependent lactate racemase [Planctomycetaceae bacterium]
MQYSLAYGREQLTVELPEKNVVKVLKIQPATALEDPKDAVFDVLEDPIEAEPLAAIAEGRKSACVVVCDSTRPVPNPEMLLPILQTLEDSGIDTSKITILIATGLRRTSTSEERHEIVGEDVMLRKFKVSDHNAKKLHQHEYLGVTKHGTPIWIDRRYLEAEVKILTGMIEPHSIAGFSGGRKAICPGIAATETVASCYSSKLLANENVRPGSIDDNPIHAEQMEVARKAGCDFVVNVLLNQDRKIAKVIGGHWNRAFLKGAELARKSQTSTVEKQVDIVVTSGGGAPFDKTWYQTIRGIVGALDIVKLGGTIIIASACTDGIGSKDFEEIVEKFASVDDFVKAVTTDEQIFVEQWQLEELAKALRKGKVKVVTGGVPAEVLQKFSVVPCETVEAAVAEALEEYGADATIAVIPEGPSVLAIAKHKEPEIKKEPAKKEPEVKKEEVEPVEEDAEKAEAKKAAKKTAKKVAVKKTETKKAAKKATKKAAKEEE